MSTRISGPYEDNTPTIFAGTGAFRCVCGSLHQLHTVRDAEDGKSLAPCGEVVRLILTTQVVEEISQIHFEGDIVHHSWFKYIRTKPTKRCPRGHPYGAAILILAHLIFWYRQSEVFDQDTDKIIGYKKKFRNDKLERSYGELEEMLGLTKRQSRRAIDRLVELGLVKREFKQIRVRGMVLNNVMTLVPIPKEILRITNDRVKNVP